MAHSAGFIKVHALRKSQFLYGKLPALKAGADMCVNVRL